MVATPRAKVKRKTMMLQQASAIIQRWVTRTVEKEGAHIVGEFVSAKNEKARSGGRCASA